MTRGIGTFLTLLFCLGALLFGLSFALRGNPDYEYAGESVFTTEEDYIAFKEFVAQDAVELIDATVPSSAPPIVAQYVYKAPSGFAQYGVEGKTLNGTAFALTFALGIYFAASATVGGLLVWAFPD